MVRRKGEAASVRGRRSVPWLALAFAGLLGACARPEPTVDFNRDIRPILTQSCTSCHGGVKAAGRVSFVFKEEAFGRGASGARTIVPGNPGASELIARVVSDDPEFRMPYHGPPLPAEQIALLRQWIKEGARWEEHWAFEPPQPQTPPPVKATDWPRGPLDQFILARLEQEGLSPQPEADKATLLRRVSLDLTGLPPSPEEVDAFLGDTRPDAYERQVDRLLASPHFGERWAALWLDLARYADSRGFEKDDDRPGVWVYRDWVVNALNDNLPYDKFVITQLAGDLLPDAGLDERIATVFNRLTPVNDEGGTDDEEFRTYAVMDRAATTWSAINGVTYNCVQCHSHPYDPIRHEEYYKFLAFFDRSVDSDIASDRPFVAAPRDPAHWAQTERHQQALDAVAARIVAGSRAAVDAASWRRAPIAAAKSDDVAALEQKIASLQADANPATSWEVEYLRGELPKARAATSSPVTFALQNGEAVTQGLGRAITVYDYTLQAVPGRIGAVRLDLLPENLEAARAAAEDGWVVTSIGIDKIAPDGRAEPIAIDAWLPDSSAAIEYRRVLLSGSSGIVNLNDGLPGRPIEGADAAQRFLGVSGIAAFTKINAPRWAVGVLRQPLTLAPGQRVRVRVSQLAPLDRNSTLRRLRVSVSDDAGLAQRARGLLEPTGALLREHNALIGIDRVPVPVMAELAAYEQRATKTFERGNFLTKTGEPHEPAMPHAFPGIGAGPPNRLGMARAFFDPKQPLTARVAVNRFWEQMFGVGLVETLEDFGSAGLPPSHPELLDWLALHFQNDLKWDSKALLKEIALSNAYRQSAKASAALVERDPDNRLLARGPRQRLTAEMVRDQALEASGLFNPKLGGPPVMPPQPAGLWSVVYSDAKWVDATGPDRYRRALYTYRKRSAPYPSFITFDGSSHEVTLARRIPTNTPLQALVTLNDPVYDEAARALARRVLAAPAASLRALAPDALSARLHFAGKLVLARPLTELELREARALYDRQAGKGQARAMAAVALMLLNHDAALNR